MKKIKQRMISFFISIDKQHERADRCCWSAFRKRFVCAWLVGIIFVTQTDLIRVFAETKPEETVTEDADEDAGLDALTETDMDATAEIVEITGFLELPAEIAGQTVALGTPYEELLLPEELTAYIVHRKLDSEENHEEETGTEEAGEQGTETEESGTEEDGKQEDKTEADNLHSGTEEDSTSGKTEADDTVEDNTDGNNTQDGSNQENGTEADDAGTDEAATGEDGIADGTKIDGNVTEQIPDAVAMPQTPDTVPWQAETSTVTMPEYQSEHVVTVETLLQDSENSQLSDIPEDNQPPAETEAVQVPDGTEQETIVIDNITWKSTPSYNGNTVGKYIFTPVLPDGYSLTGGGYNASGDYRDGGTDRCKTAKSAGAGCCWRNASGPYRLDRSEKQ